MDGLLVCAARFLASAALYRYSSGGDDIQGEHWRGRLGSLDFTEPGGKCGVGQLVISAVPAPHSGVASPDTSRARGGSGRLDDPFNSDGQCFNRSRTNSRCFSNAPRLSSSAWSIDSAISEG